MSRYPGRILSSTAPTVNANTAKGIWTLDEALRYSRAGNWPVPTGNGDPYFQYNTMLLPGQGTNGANNNTFLDSSTNNFTITRNGNTTQGTFTPFSQASGYWGNYFNGSSVIFNTSTASTGFNLTSGSFTIEAWVYFPTTVTANYQMVLQLANTAGANSGLVFGINPSGQPYIGEGTVLGKSGSTALPPNEWVHLAVVSDGTNIQFYTNGLKNGSSQAFTPNAAQYFYIGRDASGSNAITSYVSNLRVTKGGALYTNTFTPSTTPLTTTVSSGTVSLLTCQSNRFVDNSANAFAITTSGSPSIQTFQPFGAPTSAYSASTIGGSGYFDGSGDYLTGPTNTATAFNLTGNFTIECFAYFNSVSTAYAGIASWADSSGWNGWQFINNSGTITFEFITGSASAGAVSSSTAVTTGQWYHIAVARSSSTITLYLNGVSVGTSTYSSSQTSSSSYLRVGAERTTVGLTTGYISNLRVVNGTAVYTSAFTPPTAPLTAITNTQLLLSGTNAGVIDNAMDNDLETVGNAQISTTQYKWGTSSVYFDGTTDCLFEPTNTNFGYGTGDFTIECWLYLNALGTQTIISNLASAGSTAPHIYYLSGNGLRYFTASADRISGPTLSTSTWYHIAVSRTGGSTKMFVNGNQVGSTYADTNNYGATAPLGVGDYGSTPTGTSTLNGYVADLRITKGYARYPYNFTAPTAAFPLFYQAAATPSSDPYFENTTLLLPGNGTNGAQNNTFLDSSTNAFTITRNGNTTQGTFTPFSQTGWSNYFDGSGDYLTAPSNTAFNISTGDYTFECWVYKQTSSRVALVAIASAGLSIIINTSGNIEVCRSLTAIDFTFTANVPINQWTHIAVSRSGSSLQVFMNGVSLGTQSSTTTYGQGTCYVGIDADGSSNGFLGYISNLRLVKGTAVYTSNFTVPTSPLTAITNTSLLTCQSNRFIDNSTNAFTITRSGDTSVQAFSPFNPTASYSTSTVGGSGYFDGSGDTLTAPSGASISGTGDFTVEFWIYPPSAPSTYSIPVCGDTSSSFIILLNGSSGVGGAAFGTISFGRTSVAVEGTTSNTVQYGAWNHCVVSRVSGTTKMFINGVQGYSAANTTNYSSSVVRVGADANASGFFYTGYISGLRFVNGSGVTSVTVPTAPPTAITNTSLLLNYTNGGITDATAKNDLETVGGASISTTQSKFGGSSMYFDGSGDYLMNQGSTVPFAFKGDFTVEFWVYFNNTGTDVKIYDSRPASTDGVYVTIFRETSNKISLQVSGSSVITSTNTVTSGTWYHVALARYGSSTRLFINGNQEGSTYSDTNSYLCPANRPVIASSGYTLGGGTLNAYINDLRVTTGIARYTTNFTPPASAFLTL